MYIFYLLDILRGYGYGIKWHNREECTNKNKKKTKKNLLFLAIDLLLPHFDHTIGSLATLEHFQGTAVNCELVFGHFIAGAFRIQRIFKNLKITGINPQFKD
jgi:hypothetical protein